MTLNKLSTYSPSRIGLFQALGVATYVLVFGIIGTNSDRWSIHPPEFLLAMMMLIIFIVSALTNGMLVLGYPLILILRGDVKRGVTIVVWSGLWLGAIAALVFITALTFFSSSPH